MPLLPSAAHVLLIEDHPDLQDALHATLTEEGVQVTLAASCAQAQVLLRHDAFDVIFTDLFRPLHGNPFRTLEGLRHQASSTPIMVITAWPLTAEDVVRRGYQGLLSHPFEREIVVALLKQGVALNSATAAQESAGRQRSASGDEGEGISGRLPTLLKVRAAYLPAGQQPCWQPTWMNGRELAPSAQEAGLYAFVTARRIEGWVLCLTTQGMTATGIPTLRLTFRHPTT